MKDIILEVPDLRLQYLDQIRLDRIGIVQALVFLLDTFLRFQVAQVLLEHLPFGLSHFLKSCFVIVSFSCHFLERILKICILIAKLLVLLFQAVILCRHILVFVCKLLVREAQPLVLVQQVLVGAGELQVLLLLSGGVFD